MPAILRLSLAAFLAFATVCSAQTRLDPLFSELAPEIPRAEAEIALERFGAQVLRGDTSNAPEGLTLVAPPLGRNRLSILKLSQTYRGLPVHGDGGTLAIVMRDGTDLVQTHGTPIDQSRTFIGLPNPMGVLRARRAMRRLWREEGGETPFRLTRPELVAVAELGRMAYRSNVWTRVLGRSRWDIATILVDARTGALIRIEPRHSHARILATRISDQPRSLHLLMHDDLPSKAVGNSIDFSTPSGVICTPAGWTPARLGDATRLTLLSFNGSGGDDVSLFTTPRCVTGGAEASFLGGNTGPNDELPGQLYGQDLFVKTHRALALIDPMMGSLASHGGAVPYAWEHHPAINTLRHRPPLALVVDANAAWFDGAPANFKLIRVHQQDSEAIDLPVPHPLVFHCRDGQGAAAPCDAPGVQGGPLQDVAFLSIRSPEPLHTYALFHEIGHYYDQYASFGISQGNGEIIAQLFALYLMARIYDLDYTLSGLAEGDCVLDNLISQEPGVIVHPDCVTDLDDISREIDFDPSGYTVKSFTQGFWSLLWGVSCEITGGALACEGSGEVSDTYPDRWMEALLFALHLGNTLEPVELWDAMATYIDANYPGSAATLARVRALHGLE